MKLLFLLIPFICLGQIQTDKVLHYSCGVLITGVTEKVMLKLTHRPFLSKTVALSVGLTIGGAKELIWDKAWGRGQASWGDFNWTAAGCGTAIVIGIPLNHRRYHKCHAE